MKMTCEVIQDLLPLYCDGACSEESKKIVEEHLSDCEKCTADLSFMKGNVKANSTRMQEEKIVEAAARTWKKGKNKAFAIGCALILLIVIAAVGTYAGYHLFTTVNENNTDGLAKQAADYLGYKNLSIKKIERRGNYMAVLCKDEKGRICMCEFDRDSMFTNRWFVAGGKPYIEKGEISGWNYGSPQGEAVLVFCGIDIPSEVAYYEFENSGAKYTCPVEGGSVLDIFIIPYTNDIHGFPDLLDKNGKEIK